MTAQNSRHPVWISPPDSDQRISENTLEVSVIFTTVKETLPALRKAAELAQGLNLTITILAPQVVPYPLPLERPPVTGDFTERRFRTMIGRRGVATRVQVILCRDKEEALEQMLSHRSVVVIGGRERRLARKLRALGHEVISAMS